MKSHFAYYGYNASNTRTYKLSMLNQTQWANGQPLQLQLQNAMFYPNAYLTFNSSGNYTKHYYAGTERICSRLGDRTFSLDCSASLTPQTRQRLGTRIMQVDQNFRAELLELVEAGDVPVEFPNVLNLITLLPANPNANSHSHSNTSNDIFYYHTNHLGSTAFVTDNYATVTQGFLYAPFGEITTEYAPLWQNGVLPNYTFNAKELDEESGMYYYEARYYQPPVFVSRDPHFERYFWTSPYGYCNNNPLKYVDPTGMDWYETEDGNIEWTDCKNQEEMSAAELLGRYLGESVIVFHGSENEKLGKNDNLFGEGANLATATVYGKKDKDDIQSYDAYTMGSDPVNLGAIADGEYSFNYDVQGKGGKLASHWTINGRGAVPAYGGKNPNKNSSLFGKSYKNGIFIHSSNRNGFAGTYTDSKGNVHGISEGCLLIIPSIYDAKGNPTNNGWDQFNRQLSGVNKGTLILKRDAQ